jgi:hypothetical protein
MTIDSVSLGAGPTSGLVQRAYSAWTGMYLPVPFPVVWPTFLVISPAIQRIWLAQPLRIPGVDDWYEQQWW